MNVHTAQAIQTEPALTSATGLRVALFSGNYNYVRDGANQALNRLVGHLLAQGAAVRVYSPTTSTPAFEATGNLVSVPSVPIPGRPEFRAALGLPRSIEQDVRDFDPNIIHLSAPDWLGAGALRLARSLGLPVVASMHTRFETYLEYYGLRALRSWALNRQRRFYQACDHVLAPNGPNKCHLISLGVAAEKISVWGRGVDTELFSPAAYDEAWRRSLGYADDEIVILFLGRLVREKGIETFARTIAELRGRGHSVRPLIVGNGPARRAIRASLGDAMFTGHLDGRDLGRAIASANVLLNPSVTEAFGNVNLEAMASGLAVVTAEVGFSSSMITDGEDGLVAAANPRNFANAIETLMKDRNRIAAIGRQAVRTALEYRWPDVLDSVVQAYWRELRPFQSVEA